MLLVKARQVKRPGIRGGHFWIDQHGNVRYDEPPSGRRAVRDFHVGPVEGRFGERIAIPLDVIEPDPDQPRKHFDEQDLRALAASIKQEGLLQPIAVRPYGDKFRIISGERRFRAAKMAGLTHIDAIVYDVSEQKARALALLENMARRDMRPMEEARGIAELIRNHGYTIEQVADAIGRSPATVKNYLELLKLDPAVAKLVDSGAISKDIAVRMAQLSTAGQIKVAQNLGGKTLEEQRALVQAQYNLENQTELFTERRRQVHGHRLNAVARRYDEMIRHAGRLLQFLSFKRGPEGYKDLPLALKERSSVEAKRLGLLIKELQRLHRELLLYEQQAQGERKRAARKAAKAAGALVDWLIRKAVQSQGAAAGPLFVVLRKARRGEMVPGHKYIRREGVPGHYRYYYPDTDQQRVMQRTWALEPQETEVRLFPARRWPKPVTDYLAQHLSADERRLLEQAAEAFYEAHEQGQDPEAAVARALGDRQTAFGALIDRVHALLNARPELKRLAIDYARREDRAYRFRSGQYMTPDEWAAYLKKTEPLTYTEAQARLLPFGRLPDSVEEAWTRKLPDGERRILDKAREIYRQALLKDPAQAYNRLARWAQNVASEPEGRTLGISWSAVRRLAEAFTAWANDRPGLKRALMAWQQREQYWARLIGAEQRAIARHVQEQQRTQRRKQAAQKVQEVANVEFLAELASQPPNRDRAVRLIGMLQHAGLLRVVSRGARKGQVAVDPAQMRALLSSQDRLSRGLAAYAAALYRAETDRYDRGPTRFLDALAIRQGAENRYRGWLDDELLVFYVDWREKEPEKLASAPRGEDARNINGTLYLVASMLDAYNAHQDASLDAIFARQGGGAKLARADNAARRLEEEQRSAEAARLTALQAQDDTRMPDVKGLARDELHTGRPYDYQIKGVNWMLAVKRGILGFGTGLGKTLIALIASARLVQTGAVPRVIIGAPVSALTQWADEAKRFFPGMKVVVIRGTPAERRALWKQAKDADLVLVGHSLFEADPEKLSEDLKQLAALEGALILDEGDAFKNPSSLRYQTARRLMQGRTYAYLMTATPVPNWPEDTWHMLEAVRPGALGDLRRFKAHFEVVTKTQDGKVVKGFRNLEDLQRLIRPWIFIKRRTDPDVDAETPPMVKLETKLDMSDEQLAIYRLVQAGGIRTLEELADPDHIGPAVHQNLLATITKLRQVAISPELLAEWEDLRRNPDAPEAVRRWQGPSPKIQEAAKLIAAHASEQPKHPVVVFSEFNGAFRLLQRELETQHGFSPGDVAVITGEVTGKARDEAIRRINEGKVKVAFVNMRAGGAALNLQKAANMVVFLHDPYRPRDIEQAQSRVWRQGQKHKVAIVHLRMAGSIDEHIVEVLHKKAIQAKPIMEGRQGEEVSPRLTFQEYAQLLGMSGEEAQALYQRLKAQAEAWIRKAATARKGRIVVAVHRHVRR